MGLYMLGKHVLFITLSDNTVNGFHGGISNI